MFNCEIDVCSQRIGIVLEDEVVESIHKMSNTQLMILRTQIGKDIKIRTIEVMEGK
jgi:hypothetical protein